MDREHNLSPAATEVGFSQQAVGMIQGAAQYGEGDHRDDIPTHSRQFHTGWPSPQPLTGGL